MRKHFVGHFSSIYGSSWVSLPECTISVNHQCVENIVCTLTAVRIMVGVPIKLCYRLLNNTSAVGAFSVTFWKNNTPALLSLSGCYIQILQIAWTVFSSSSTPMLATPGDFASRLAVLRIDSAAALCRINLSRSNIFHHPNLLSWWSISSTLCEQILLTSLTVVTIVSLCEVSKYQHYTE